MLLSNVASISLFILGFLAFCKANEAIQTIDTYQVAQDRRGLAVAAKILGIVDIVLWACGLILRFALQPIESDDVRKIQMINTTSAVISFGISHVTHEALRILRRSDPMAFWLAAGGDGAVAPKVGMSPA